MVYAQPASVAVCTRLLLTSPLASKGSQAVRPALRFRHAALYSGCLQTRLTAVATKSGSSAKVHHGCALSRRCCAAALDTCATLVQQYSTGRRVRLCEPAATWLLLAGCRDTRVQAGPFVRRSPTHDDAGEADASSPLPMNTRARRLRTGSSAEQDAAACGAPAEASPRRSRAAPLQRVPSEQLLATARLVRTESSKHLLQHLTMIASGAVLWQLWVENAAAEACLHLALRR